MNVEIIILMLEKGKEDRMLAQVILLENEIILNELCSYLKTLSNIDYSNFIFVNIDSLSLFDKILRKTNRT